MPSLTNYYISSPGAITSTTNTVTYNDGGTTNLDHALGTVFSLNANGTGTTIDHINIPSGRYSFELHLQWIAGTITWPSSWTKGDSAPTATGGYVITGITVDGGISWKISVLNIGSLWTPANISSSLWLDAADISTITEVSGAVSQWNDKSTQNRHATQGTATRRPILASADLASKDTISFPKNEDTDPDFLSVNMPNFETFNFLLVATQDGSTVAPHFGDLRNNESFVPVLYASSDGIVGYRNGVDLGYHLVSTGVVNSGYSLIEMSKFNRTFTGGINAIRASTTCNTEVFNHIRIGARGVNTWSNGFNGKIAEIILLVGAVFSTSDRQKIEGYLAHKWNLATNLPSNHPYKQQAPII